MRCAAKAVTSTTDRCVQSVLRNAHVFMFLLALFLPGLWAADVTTAETELTHTHHQVYAGPAPDLGQRRAHSGLFHPPEPLLLLYSIPIPAASQSSVPWIVSKD